MRFLVIDLTEQEKIILRTALMDYLDDAMTFHRARWGETTKWDDEHLAIFKKLGGSYESASNR